MIGMRRLASAAVGTALLACAFGPSRPGQAAGPLVQISSDTYTSTTDTAQHATQVEPSIAAFGSTIVAVVQTGRFTDDNGGSTNIAWATSTNSGRTWMHGVLPGITVAAGGPNDRASDPSVAYDAKHGVWMIASLPIVGADSPGVLVSRSTNGGLTWNAPTTVTTQLGTDKDWITCDTTAASPYYGHCYAEWDNYDQGDVVYMSTSTDGGLTWSTPYLVNTNNGDNGGIGGTPVVQPNGTVIVPINDGYEENLLSYRSTDGGLTWNDAMQVATLQWAFDPGFMRNAPLQSAGVDRNGKVYVVWTDCRFEAGCESNVDCPYDPSCVAANDFVMTTTTDGLHWTPVKRLAIDAVGSNVDHLLPGLAVDSRTAGGRAHLAMGFYYFPNANCSFDDCRLVATTALSYDGGQTWSRPMQLVNSMPETWMAYTNAGYMVGDYIATAFTANGLFHPVFSVASAPTGDTYRQATYTLAGGL